jgi:uncharacterized membrane protein (TIGR02234 family)
MNDAPARRERLVALLLCAGGAALALLAATRTWVTVRTARPAPLPAATEELTGREIAPWVVALAFVALAGAGALLAVRRTGRVLVGLALAVFGALIVTGSLLVVLNADTEGVRSEAVRAVWPLGCAVGGLAVAAAGVLAVVRGPRWPGLGGRYERDTGSGTAPVTAAAEADRPAEVHPDASAAAWDALDQGRDPTR